MSGLRASFLAFERDLSGRSTSGPNQRESHLDLGMLEKKLRMFPRSSLLTRLDTVPVSNRLAKQVIEVSQEEASAPLMVQIAS